MSLMFSRFNTLLQKWFPASCLSGFAKLFRSNLPVQLKMPGDSWHLIEYGCAKVTDRFNVELDSIVALALPEELVLETKLIMPVLNTHAVAQAVSLHAKSMSPFVQADTACAWYVSDTDGAMQTVRMVLTSKRAIDAELNALRADLPALSQTPEVWFVNNDQQPFIFTEWGGSVRKRKDIVSQFIGWGLSGAVALTVIAIAISPTVQLRLRAIQAYQAYIRLVDDTHPHVTKRTELLKLTEQAQDISKILSDRGNPSKLLALMTQLLPDDTHLQIVDMQGLKLKISGVTGNASNLMQMLGSRIEFKDIKAPVPATRQLGSNQEVFTFELMLNPEIMSSLTGVQSVPAVATTDGDQPSPAKASHVQ